MKAVERFRFHVQSLLARGLAAPTAACAAGIVGASEIWGGVEPRDRPGWYVWLRGRLGAYALDLEACDAPGDGVVRGRLSVRYYPRIDDPAFDSFSARERALVAGGWMDGTGAPAVERAASIGAPLFVVGALEIVADATGATRVVGMSALERARAPGRDVPGFALTLPPFSAVAALVAQVGRRSAARLVELEQPGFELVARGEAVVEQDTGSVSIREALLLFPGGEGPTEDDLLGLCLDADARVLRNVRLDDGTYTSAGEHAGRGLSIARGWFASGAAPCETIGCCS